MLFAVNFTKRPKAKIMKNRGNGKNITKPIEAKPLTDNYKLQNQSYLKNPITKRLASLKQCFLTPFLQNES
jgi:hypothetical protein